MKNKKVRLDTALLLGVLITTALASQTTQAADSWFAGLGLKQTRLNITDNQFQSHGIGGHVGKWLAPGIGLQLAAALPLDEASEGEVTVKLNSLTSAGLRLESPSSKSTGVAASVAFGGAVSQIDATSALSGDTSSYSGYFFSGGLTYTLHAGTQVLIDYSRYNFESDLSITDLRVSFRKRF